MDFLCLGATKLKVTLTKAECDEYNIDPADSEPTDKDVRRTLRKILSLAEGAAGFKVGAEKLLIQFYPLNEGGCELFITKLSSIPERERRAITESDTLSTYQDRDSIYMFEDFDTLLAAVKTIDRVDVRCDVFYSYSGQYYIKLQEHTVNGVGEFHHLIEFGVKLGSLPFGMMGEWGREIIHCNGVAVLSQL